MINAALMAKIHTVEWTPAILAASGAQIAHEGELVGPRDRAPAPRDRPHQRERGVRRHAAVAASITTASTTA